MQFATSTRRRPNRPTGFQVAHGTAASNLETWKAQLPADEYLTLLFVVREMLDKEIDVITARRLRRAA